MCSIISIARVHNDVQEVCGSSSLVPTFARVLWGSFALPDAKYEILESGTAFAHTISEATWLYT